MTEPVSCAVFDREINNLRLQITTLEKHLAELRKADQEAIKVLATNFEGRMANTNEWRSTVESQQDNFAAKESTERRLKALEDAQLANASKTIGSNQLYGTAAAIVFVVGAIMAIIFGLFGGE